MTSSPEYTKAVFGISGTRREFREFYDWCSKQEIHCARVMGSMAFPTDQVGYYSQGLQTSHDDYILINVAFATMLERAREWRVIDRISERIFNPSSAQG